MTEPDPYDDGLALVLTLRQPATESDVAAADELLEEWLAAYEEDGKQRYRNSGREGEVGAVDLVLWADRIADPAAKERLSSIGKKAEERIALQSWRIGGTDDLRDADMQKRVGVPVLPVRPGGDAVGEAQAKGLLPSPRGLAPALAWLVPILLARIAARGVEGENAVLLASGGTLVGVLLLAVASFRYCSAREHALAALAVLANGVHLFVGLRMPEHENVDTTLRWGALFATLAWAYFWLQRAPLRKK